MKYLHGSFLSALFLLFGLLIALILIIDLIAIACCIYYKRCKNSNKDESSVETAEFNDRHMEKNGAFLGAAGGGANFDAETGYPAVLAEHPSPSSRGARPPLHFFARDAKLNIVPPMTKKDLPPLPDDVKMMHSAMVLPSSPFKGKGSKGTRSKNEGFIRPMFREDTGKKNKKVTIETPRVPAGGGGAAKSNSEAAESSSKSSKSASITGGSPSIDIGVSEFESPDLHRTDFLAVNTRADTPSKHDHSRSASICSYADLIVPSVEHTQANKPAPSISPSTHKTDTHADTLDNTSLKDDFASDSESELGIASKSPKKFWYDNEVSYLNMPMSRELEHYMAGNKSPVKALSKPSARSGRATGLKSAASTRLLSSSYSRSDSVRQYHPHMDPQRKEQKQREVEAEKAENEKKRKERLQDLHTIYDKGT